MSKASQFRDMSLEELEATYNDKRKELFTLINEREFSPQFEKPHRIDVLKKEIARMLTIRTEKQA